MKFIVLLLLAFSPALSCLTACTGSHQGNTSAPAMVTLGFATTESGQLELFNVKNGSSYGVVTSGTKIIGVTPGTVVKAVWTPAASDPNTAEYWLNSGITASNQAVGATEYTFTVRADLKIQMHLSSPANAVQITAPVQGILSWSLNGVSGQVAAGGSNATISVRESDTFSVSWTANGSAYYISLWEIVGPSLSDRSKKDLASTPLTITSATTVNAEITSRPLPHYRLQIPTPIFGEFDFINPESGAAISLPAGGLRYGSIYEVLTDNNSSTTATVTITYEDNGSGFGVNGYIYDGASIPMTILQSSSENNDHSLRFKTVWNFVISNSGHDPILTYSFADQQLSCNAIGKYFVDSQCFDGNYYCPLHGKTFNGTTCN